MVRKNDITLISSLIIFIILFVIFMCSSIRAETTAEVEETQLYYFTDGSNKCKRQLPIIKILKVSGFNFEIIEEDDPRVKEYQITVFPTILVITGDTVVRLEGLQPLRKLIKVIRENRKKEPAALKSGIDLLFFTSEKCGGCEQQLPIIRTLQADGFDFQILERNQQNKKLFTKYNVYVVPTIIIDVENNVNIRLVGHQPLGKLQLILSPFRR